MIACKVYCAEQSQGAGSCVGEENLRCELLVGILYYL